MFIIIVVSFSLILLGLVYFVIQYNVVKKQSQIYSDQLVEIKSKLEEEQKQKNEMALKNAIITTQLEERQKEIEQLKQNKSSLNSEIEQAVLKGLDQQDEKLRTVHSQTFRTIIEPLKAKFESLSNKSEEINTNRIQAETELKLQIAQQKELIKEMTQESKTLAGVISRNNKVQGNYGEQQLERILQSTGFIKDVNYYLQATGEKRDEEAEQTQSRRPDAILKIFSEQLIVIDAKMSLKDYASFVEKKQEGSQKEAEEYNKKFVESIRHHVKGLSKKEYQELQYKDPKIKGKSYGMVLMFMPLESAYVDLIHDHYDVFIEAYDKKVVIVGVASLLNLLKTFQMFEDQQKQYQNMEEILKEMELLQNMFIDTIKNVDKAYDYLARAQKEFGVLVNKINPNEGSIVKKIIKIEQLGQKSKKKVKEILKKPLNTQQNNLDSIVEEKDECGDSDEINLEAN